MKISIDLLSDIFKKEVVKYNIVFASKITQIRVWFIGDEEHLYFSYDIYHLLFMLENYILDSKYAVKIESHYKNSHRIMIMDINNNKGWIEPFKKTFKAKSHAIIELSEYIYKNIKG